MIRYVPAINDGADERMFVPMLATLYGRDETPHRFVRVVRSATQKRSVMSFENTPGDPSTYSIVETVDSQTFLQFATYGYTPYIECLLSGFKSKMTFREDQQSFFISQAALRHYEQRCKALIELCERKRLSIMSFQTSKPVTGELVNELEGALAIWEMLMNTGTAKTADCLSFLPGKRSDSPLIPMDKFKGTFVELCERLAMDNFFTMQFKVSDEQRDRLLSADQAAW